MRDRDLKDCRSPGPLSRAAENRPAPNADHPETFLDVELSPSDQQDLMTLLQLDLAPLSPQAVSHTFLGLTLIGWLVAPERLTAFFGMEEAVERWHRQYESSRERRSLRRARSH
jgi:hypothetical protein